MSYQARYDTEYEVRREARKKAFKRKRRRMRRIFALCFLCFILALGILALYGAYRGIRFLYDSYMERVTFVDYSGDGREIWLVDNVYSSDDDESAFYEIIRTEKTDNEEEDDYSQYAGIEPGSRGLIIVDAGHGGYDGGAENNGIIEKNINLSIAYCLRDELVKRGYKVYMTRPDDEFVGLQQRASLANSLTNPKCLISIHQNSVDDYEAVCGMEAWTYDRSGCTELGNIICEEASKTTGAANRGTNYRTNLVVTSKTTMPAIIFECGYLSNYNEANLLNSAEYQKKISKGIANGVDRFVDTWK